MESVNSCNTPPVCFPDAPIKSQVQDAVEAAINDPEIGIRSIVIDSKQGSCVLPPNLSGRFFDCTFNNFQAVKSNNVLYFENCTFTEKPLFSDCLIIAAGCRFEKGLLTNRTKLELNCLRRINEIVPCEVNGQVINLNYSEIKSGGTVWDYKEAIAPSNSGLQALIENDIRQEISSINSVTRVIPTTSDTTVEPYPYTIPISLGMPITLSTSPFIPPFTTLSNTGTGVDSSGNAITPDTNLILDANGNLIPTIVTTTAPSASAEIFNQVAGTNFNNMSPASTANFFDTAINAINNLVDSFTNIICGFFSSIDMLMDNILNVPMGILNMIDDCIAKFDNLIFGALATILAPLNKLLNDITGNLAKITSLIQKIAGLPDLIARLVNNCVMKIVNMPLMLITKIGFLVDRASNVVTKLVGKIVSVGGKIAYIKNQSVGIFSNIKEIASSGSISAAFESIKSSLRMLNITKISSSTKEVFNLSKSHFLVANVNSIKTQVTEAVKGLQSTLSFSKVKEITSGNASVLNFIDCGCSFSNVGTIANSSNKATLKLVNTVINIVPSRA